MSERVKVCTFPVGVKLSNAGATEVEAHHLRCLLRQARRGEHARLPKALGQPRLQENRQLHLNWLYVLPAALRVARRTGDGRVLPLQIEVRGSQARQFRRAESRSEGQPIERGSITTRQPQVRGARFRCANEPAYFVRRQRSTPPSAIYFDIEAPHGEERIGRHPTISREPTRKRRHRLQELVARPRRTVHWSLHHVRRRSPLARSTMSNSPDNNGFVSEFGHGDLDLERRQIGEPLGAELRRHPFDRAFGVNDVHFASPTSTQERCEVRDVLADRPMLMSHNCLGAHVDQPEPQLGHSCVERLANAYGDAVIGCATRSFTPLARLIRVLDDPTVSALSLKDARHVSSSFFEALCPPMPSHTRSHRSRSPCQQAPRLAPGVLSSAFADHSSR